MLATDEATPTHEEGSGKAEFDPLSPRCGAHKRDLAALEQRRLHAAELFEQGLIPAEIARRVGVRHQIVSQWRKAWRRGGRDALRSGGPVGRRPKLTTQQLQLVNTALVTGAVAFGYSSDVWTLPRVAEVIQRVTACRITLATCGTCCGSSCIGPGGDARDAPSNAMTRLSMSGSSSGGRT